MNNETLKDWQAFLLEALAVVALTYLVASGKTDMIVWVSIIGPMVGARAATRGARAGTNAAMAGASLRPAAIEAYVVPDPARPIPPMKPPT